MFLRRVTEHLKSQNWVAVALDLIIVILGVFMGFQIDRWYEAVREGAERTQYLERLLADATLSIDATESTRQYISQVTDNVALVHKSLLDCDLPTEEQDRFAMGLFHHGKLIPAQFVRGTLDEITSAGKIGLIRSTHLRDALNEAVREFEYENRAWPAIQGKRNAHAVYVEQRYMFKIEEQKGGFASVTWSELHVDFEALCHDAKFQSSMSRILQLHHVNLDWLDRNLKNFRRLKGLIEGELQ